MPVKTKNRATLVNLNAKTGMFIVVKKVDGEYKQISQAEAYEGNLVGLSFSTYEYEGREKFKINLKFSSKRDGTEIVSMTANNVSASILNKLASLDDLTNIRITISLYKNKKDFISDYVEITGTEEGLSWKYDWTKLQSVMKSKERLEAFVESLQDKIDQDQVNIEKFEEESQQNSPEDFYKNAAKDARDIGDEDVPEEKGDNFNEKDDPFSKDGDDLFGESEDDEEEDDGLPF